MCNIAILRVTDGRLPNFCLHAGRQYVISTNHLGCSVQLVVKTVLKLLSGGKNHACVAMQNNDTGSEGVKDRRQLDTKG